jgi:zinc/manganese transport system permease protein
VAGFQALGTLMSVGLMMLPAAAARFWAREVWTLGLTSAALALAAGYAGLLFSYHANLPSGPAIILTAAAGYVISLAAGTRGSLRTRYLVKSHIHA